LALHRPLYQSLVRNDGAFCIHGLGLRTECGSPDVQDLAFHWPL